MELLSANAPGGREALYDVASRRWWTYAQVREAVRSLARTVSLPRKGLVFVLCRNDVATVLALLACLRAGHAVALLDAEVHSEFRAKLLEIYRPELLVTSMGSRLPDDGVSSYHADLTLDRDLQVWRRDGNEGGTIHADLGILLSTSGSTGTPKLVRLSHANVESNARAIVRALGIGADERAITSLPIHYSYGLSLLTSHLVAGASVVVTDAGILTANFWDAFRLQGCSSFSGVPYHYQMLARLSLRELAVPTLRTMTQAGGKLDVDVIARFHREMCERDGRFIVMYGQTEATARMAYLPSEQLPGKLGSVGRAIPGGSFAIAPSNGEDEGPGEIVYRGPNVMLGYAHAREDLALGDVTGSVLHTGDLGRLDAEGYLYITGRTARFVKLFGSRVNLDDVEAMMRGDGPIVVAARDDRLTIFCEHPAPGFKARARALCERLRVHPSAIDVRAVDAIPRTPAGKVDYPRLLSLVR